jgi:hypothetical protein
MTLGYSSRREAHAPKSRARVLPRLASSCHRALTAPHVEPISVGGPQAAALDLVAAREGLHPRLSCC